MRNKDRYSDKVRRVITVIKAEVESNDFICYTTASGNTLTTMYTNQVELGVPTAVYITYDNKFNKWRLLEVIKGETE